MILIPAGQEHILEQSDGKKRLVLMVAELSRAFALCAASDEAKAIRNDKLKLIAGEPITMVRQSVTIAWSLRANARGQRSGCW